MLNISCHSRLAGPFAFVVKALRAVKLVRIEICVEIQDATTLATLASTPFVAEETITAQLGIKAAPSPIVKPGFNPPPGLGGARMS